MSRSSASARGLHPISRPRLTGPKSYAFAFGLVAVAIVLTRFTWPVFSRAPYSPLFGAVYLVATFATPAAAWIAMLMGGVVSPLMFPVEQPPLFVVGGAVVYATISGVAIHLISARRKAEAELRASEQRLRQAQKMEAVGQLVAGVAHNFNNLLTITMGYTDLLVDKYPNDADARAALEEIRKATGRGAALTRQLLAFSRQREGARILVDLNKALADLRDLLLRIIREDVHLTIDAAPAPASALVDLQEFEQAILNLVINARDALPAGGHIWIDASLETLDAPKVVSDLLLQPGPYACVRVRDDGIGMPPEVQSHLFEPFFTTKDVGKGTGLGLASIYGVVRRHRGGISVDSAVGKGTTVTLYFPATPPRPGTEMSQPSKLPAHTGLETSPKFPL